MAFPFPKDTTTQKHDVSLRKLSGWLPLRKLMANYEWGTSVVVEGYQSGNDKSGLAVRFKSCGERDLGLEISIIQPNFRTHIPAIEPIPVLQIPAPFGRVVLAIALLTGQVK